MIEKLKIETIGSFYRGFLIRNETFYVKGGRIWCSYRTGYDSRYDYLISSRWDGFKFLVTKNT